MEKFGNLEVEAYAHEPLDVHSLKIEEALDVVIGEVKLKTGTRMAEPELREFLVAEGREALEELSKDKGNDQKRKAAIETLSGIITRNQERCS